MNKKAIFEPMKNEIMKVKYVRVSSLDQNPERQLKFDGKVYPDKCSGSIPFNERPFAKKLIQDIEKGIKEVHVHSIDRLGRNTLDVLKTIQMFTSKGVNVISEKEGLQTLLPDGKENPTAKLIINILASVSEMERNNIRERQREGIEIAKKKGVYRRPRERSGLSRTQILKKYPKAVKAIKAGYKLREVSKLYDISLGTASNLKRLIDVE